MPIYAYKCSSCGFEKDYLQKMSDKPLTKCPKCGKETFRKELSAPGFELKGTGWQQPILAAALRPCPLRTPIPIKTDAADNLKKPRPAFQAGNRGFFSLCFPT